VSEVENESEEAAGNLNMAESKITNEQRVAMLKALKSIPNIISVESVVGIVYAKDVSESERKNHDKATERTFFKLRQQYLKNQRVKKHEEEMNKSYHRKPSTNTDL
jgi:CRISPR/Cas system-associated protein Cas5 (RAMP superfamily)